MIFRSAAYVLALTSAASAEEVTQEFLEQPGIVWVAAELPPRAISDRLGAPIPFMVFADGAVEAGFLSLDYGLSASTCEKHFECLDRTNEAVIYAGAYTLADGSVVSDAEPSPDWIYDGPMSSEMITLHPLAEAEAQFTIDGDALVHSGPDGTLRFLPIPPEARFQALSVPFAMQVPMGEFYACTAQRLFDLSHVPAEQWSPAEQELAAFAVVAERLAAIDGASRVVTSAGFSSTFDEATQDQADQIQTESTALSLAWGFTVSDLIGLNLPPLSQIPQGTIDLVTSVPSDIIPDAPDPVAAQDALDAIYPTMLIAAPLMARLQGAEGGRTNVYLSEICGLE